VIGAHQMNELLAEHPNLGRRDQMSGRSHHWENPERELYNPKRIYIAEHYNVKMVEKALELSAQGYTHIMINGWTLRACMPKYSVTDDKRFRTRAADLRLKLELKPEAR
jgi:hypothetical protein